MEKSNAPFTSITFDRVVSSLTPLLNLAVRPLGRVHADRILETVDVVFAGLAFLPTPQQVKLSSHLVLKEHDVLQEGWSVVQMRPQPVVSLARYSEHARAPPLLNTHTHTHTFEHTHTHARYIPPDRQNTVIGSLGTLTPENKKTTATNMKIQTCKEYENTKEQMNITRLQLCRRQILIEWKRSGMMSHDVFRTWFLPRKWRTNGVLEHQAQVAAAHPQNSWATNWCSSKNGCLESLHFRARALRWM